MDSLSSKRTAEQIPLNDAGTARTEWELLCACVSVSLWGASAAQLPQLLSAQIDWGHFYALARGHGVVVSAYRTLVAHGGPQVPAAWLEKLRSQALTHGRRNLLTAQELVRLMGLLAYNGIDSLALKGPVLAATAYGDLSLRQYGDLDILVHPQAVATVAEVLLNDDYFTDGNVFETERPFGRRDGWVVVDLHWGVTVPRFAPLLDEVGMWQRAQTVPLAGGQVRTFALEDHLLAMAVHGFKDGWSRLKWVADVAVLVQRRQDLDWDVLLRRAEAQSALRVLWVALGLAQQLLALELPVAIQTRLDRDRAVPGLCRRLLDRLRDENGIGALADGWGTYRIQMGTLTEPNQRLAYTAYSLGCLFTPNAEDQRWLPLPAALARLHYLSRPVRLLWWYGLPRLRQRVLPDPLRSDA